MTAAGRRRPPSEVSSSSWQEPSGGDRDTEFLEFVVLRCSRLSGIARLLTAGDEHAAEDLVQGCLERLYVNWSRIRQDEGPDAYARRVLVNLAIDEARRPWRRLRVRAEVPDVAAIPHVHGPEGQPFDERAAVQQALRQLSPRMRAAVVLRHWLDLDVQETARVLGCSEGTVKSQTARGLDRLRTLLAPTVSIDSITGGTP